jgi:hypothetical protein
VRKEEEAFLDAVLEPLPEEFWRDYEVLLRQLWGIPCPPSKEHKNTNGIKKSKR